MLKHIYVYQEIIKGYLKCIVGVKLFTFLQMSSIINILTFFFKTVICTVKHPFAYRARSTCQTSPLFKKVNKDFQYLLLITAFAWDNKSRVTC